MLRIFHIPDFRSLRVIWLMEELGEPYEIERVQYPIEDAFRSVGTGSVPAVDDDGVVMGESIAILQYLTGRRLQRSLELGLTVGPNPDPAAYAEHLQFLHLGEASLMTPITMIAITRRLAPESEKANFTVARCERNVANRLAVVERRLADGRPHLTGQAFTIADISVGYALHYARRRELEGLIPERTTAYLDRVSARPAFQRAVAA
jgi:glutathione S-transferase/3-isopropylmalate dehydratase